MKPVVSQAARAYAFLQDRLRDGTLKPGDRIDLASIAARLSISRQPVRDALKLLEGESLVRSMPQVGFSVVEYTTGECIDVFELHGLIECEVAELAASRRTEGQLLELRSNHRESRSIVANLRTTDPAAAHAAYARVRELGRAFHHIVYAMTDSADLEALAGASYLRYDLAFFRIDLAETPRDEIDDRIAVASRQHERMIEALAAKDPVAARAIAEEHEAGRMALFRKRVERHEAGGA